MGVSGLQLGRNLGLGLGILRDRPFNLGFTLDKLLSSYSFNDPVLDTTLSVNSVQSIRDTHGLFSGESQATKALMPVYTASNSNMGGQPTAAGVAAGYLNSDNTNLDWGTSGSMWFGCVIRSHATISAQKRIFGSVSLSGTANFVGRITASKMNFVVVDSVTTRTLNGGTTLTASTNYILEYEISGTTMRVYLNGVSDGSINTLVATPASNALQLFNKGANATEGFLGDLGRIDICSAKPLNVSEWRRACATTYNVSGVTP